MTGYLVTVHFVLSNDIFFVTDFIKKEMCIRDRVEDIKTGTAEKVAGIACILTYKDVPQKRFTLAGQTAPEMSPDDLSLIHI